MCGSRLCGASTAVTATRAGVCPHLPDRRHHQPAQSHPAPPPQEKMSEGGLERGSWWSAGGSGAPSLGLEGQGNNKGLEEYSPPGALTPHQRSHLCSSADPVSVRPTRLHSALILCCCCSLCYHLSLGPPSLSSCPTSLAPPSGAFPSAFPLILRLLVRGPFLGPFLGNSSVALSHPA